MLEFEWNSAKAERNLKQHGISFELAELVFDDPYLIYRRDLYLGELRDHGLGAVGGSVLILVVHTVTYEDESKTRIRLISARAADQRERRLYREARA